MVEDSFLDETTAIHVNSFIVSCSNNTSQKSMGYRETLQQNYWNPPPSDQLPPAVINDTAMIDCFVEKVGAHFLMLVLL
jgi:hypothetical protein